MTSRASEGGESAVQAAQLQRDLAEIDLAVAKARQALQDERLTMLDVSSIHRAAERFGVSPLDAYRRARELGLLSYQQADPDHA